MIIAERLGPKRAFGRWRARALGVGAAASVVFGAAGVRAAEDFPGRNDLASVRSWLARSAHIPESRLAVLTATSAFTVVEPAGPQGDGAVVRQEIIDPVSAEMLGGRSARVRLAVDCARAVVTVSSVEIFAARGLQGAAHPSTLALWRSADPDAALDDLSPVLCRPRAEDPPALAPPVVARSPTDATPRGTSAGARYVQIGAFSSLATAQAAFESLRRRLPDEVQGLGLTTEPIAGRGLNRALLGPFADDDAARTFCARAISRGASCFVR